MASRADVLVAVGSMDGVAMFGRAVATGFGCLGGNGEERLVRVLQVGEGGSTVARQRGEVFV